MLAALVICNSARNLFFFPGTSVGEKLSTKDKQQHQQPATNQGRIRTAMMQLSAGQNLQMPPRSV